jgi:uncharacterized protein
VTTFADSSALVKLYVDEPGCEDVRWLHPLLASELARVEVPAAIWRKHRMGVITPAQAAVLVAAFEVDYHGAPDQARRIVAVATTGAVLDAAAKLCAIHGLRAYDAVQLATACAAATALPECRVFAAYDESLRAAAAVEGFTLLPISGASP